MGWFVGFVEGDGSFCLRIQKPTGKKKSYQVTCIFSVGQKGNPNAVYATGQILVRHGIDPHFTHAKSGYLSLWVAKLEDCIKLANLLESCTWYGNKRKVFELWKTGLEIMREKRHRTESGFRQVLSLRDEMRKYSKKYAHYKYSKKYFSGKSRFLEGSTQWRDEEVRVLVENYSDKPTEELLKLIPKRSLHAIEVKAYSLGLKRKSRIRKSIDINKVRQLYDEGLPIWKIGKILGVSADLIHTRMVKHGIPRRLPAHLRNLKRESL